MFHTPESKQNVTYKGGNSVGGDVEMRKRLLRG